MNTWLVRSVLLGVLLPGGFAQEPRAPEQPPPEGAAQCPMHLDHAAAAEAHQKALLERGDHEMGFAHDRTVHHFRLLADGGTIEAAATDARDTTSRDQIRAHFAHIVEMFRAGDFTVPMLIHAQNPPGAQAMARLRGRIEYRVEETGRGARIRVVAKNDAALRAVHDFLRFQIADHRTADRPEIERPQ